MDFKITKEDVCDFLKESRKHIGNLALKIYGNSLNQEGERAFSEAIEIGIENTIASLYDANVQDEEIIRVVCEHWGMQKSETEERLLYEKSQAAIRSLKYYLKMQGFSKAEVQQFMFSNNACIKIRRSKELWKLKNDPKKLMKVVVENKGD